MNPPRTGCDSAWVDSSAKQAIIAMVEISVLTVRCFMAIRTTAIFIPTGRILTRVETIFAMHNPLII
jgi:hypothetical protein